MTNANECTCPSGDGSLRHPCPAHPASVELAGVAANLTFINGRPAMCGCQVEYSSGGGEYSDVIDVTLCAKHSGSAILDLVATNRIALTPEYEGQWHADLYLDREIPLAKAEGATPAEAVLALMSAERIDPEQGGVDQAGGDRWDALQSIMEWTAAENIPDDRKLCLIRNAARAALAQPSPVPADEKPGDSILCYGCFAKGVGPEHFDEAGKCLARQQTEPLGAEFAQVLSDNLPELLSTGQAEQAEAERPEVVGYRSGTSGGIYADGYGLEKPEPLMTVAQHERIVGELRAVIAQLRQHKNDYMDSGQETYRALQNEIREREAEIARLDGLVSGRTAERDAALAEVERLRQFERICGGLPQDAIDGGWTVQGIRGYAKRLEDQLKVALDRVAELENQEPVAYVLFRDGEVYYETDDNIVISNTPGDETDLYRWLPVFTAPAAQAQQLHDLDKQCRDDVARALGLRPNEERGFAWSYLLSSIKACVKASENTAQAGQVPAAWYYDAPSQAEAAIIDIRGMWGEDDCPTYEDVAAALRRLLAAAPGKEGL
ncbi:hypothetical protein [Pseudomonas aeruginosa]|uniref:hypothetical protein n=1 Tax=Pseudomonas aeruginosa TaxID=287 RepID=UPI003DA6E339